LFTVWPARELPCRFLRKIVQCIWPVDSLDESMPRHPLVTAARGRKMSILGFMAR
jgi:hypothetical protein